MFSSDQLLERAKLKSQISLWRAVCVVFALLVVIVFFSSSGDSDFADASVLGKPYVARISVDGIIFENKDRTEILKSIAENDSIKAVIMEINSPGGSAVGGEEFYNSLQKIRDKKPVVAVMNSLAASAGYLISLGANRSFAHNGTITGSIGVIAEIPNVKKAADKLGVEFNYVKSSPLKGSPSPFEDKNPQALNTIKTAMMDFYDYFVDVVAKERKINRKQAESLADGRIFSAKAALKNKLIDEIGGSEAAFNWLVKNKKIAKDIKIKEIKLYKPKPPFSEFVESLMQRLDFKSILGDNHFKGLTL